VGYYIHTVLSVIT